VLLTVKFLIYSRIIAWSSLFPARDELVAYYNRFADAYNLRSLTSFNTNVISATWSSSTLTWSVVTENTLTKRRTTWRTSILIHAPGTYNRSVTPNVPGIESFKGDMWHTYDWPVDADSRLRGKTVAYIGSGPSAVQILPKIEPIVKELKVYMRSMTYVLPMSNMKKSACGAMAEALRPRAAESVGVAVGKPFWPMDLFSVSPGIVDG
jgi:cation diffusion facilitator CzcD-associated flavoprotein CzcO